jgi:hypothetical protein
MALLTKTPDAELDVIDGGFRTKPALGLKELGYLSVAHRGWKLKHAPIACLDTILLESPGFCDIHAGFFRTAMPRLASLRIPGMQDLTSPICQRIGILAEDEKTFRSHQDAHKEKHQP